MLIKNASQMIEAVSTALQAEGKEEKFYNLEKALEMKKELGHFETKANEVVHTGNTGFGAELVPGAIQTTDFLDIIPTYSPFIQAMTGSHGRNMNLLSEVPVIGKLPKHQIVDEATTNLMVFANGRAKTPTAKITIAQKKFFLDVDVSDEEVRFVNVVDVVATIQRKLAQSAAETQEAFMLNGDTVTAVTGNINNDDAAPTAGTYYLGGNGLRKAGLANGADVGALTFDDFLTVLALMGENAANPADLVWIFNPQTRIKALGITEFKDYSVNGRASTIVTGALSNFLGSDVFTSEEFLRTKADGKISSVTPANNTKG